MIILREPLKNKNQTGREMYRLVRSTSKDLRKIMFRDGKKVKSADRLPLVQWFDFVKNIPYRIDPKPREIIARPAHIVNFQGLGADCKKKSILIGSWLRENKVPFRFIASSRRKDKKIHHVWPQGNFGGKWVCLDATYKNNAIGMKRNDTKQEILKP